MTRKQLIFAGVLPLVLAIGTSAGACLWDSDTLQMERLRFPGVLEIITGKFVRHSPAYYEWRIKDRLKKLEATPDDPALIDDLAVGYDKLGRYDEGIAVLEKSLAADPNRYETLANLATLLFHAGRLEESKQHVQRALEINPYAHFGREKYQLLLTEYVLQSELNSAGVLSTDERYPMGGGAGPRGFARYVIVSKYGEDENLQYSLGGSEAERGARQTELQDAAKGVLGMLHFADHESPVLLEALGDLLITGELDANGTRLGARAYLRAAQMSKDAATADRFRRMAHDALANQLPYGKDYDPEKVDLSHLEKELAAELTQGAEFFSQIEARERQWIDNELDVDREFATAYYDSLDETIAAATRDVESQPAEPRPSLSTPRVPTLVVVMAWLVPALFSVAAIAAVVLWFRRRKRLSPVSAIPVSKPNRV
jgi:tetratricopeptide (TPR) repeat protein